LRHTVEQTADRLAVNDVFVYLYKYYKACIMTAHYSVSEKTTVTMRFLIK